MKFLDLFAGIGGFRLGMEAVGHECIGFCEIDKFARLSYKSIHETKGEVEFHDITRVSDDAIRGLGSVDIICGGFPCQAFSIAGNRRGFEDTRGTLFFEVARFASLLKPKYLFLENVRGLLSHDGGATFATIIRTLDELGYDVEWQVLNSKNFGVPQNRERVFIIGHSRGRSTRPVFPLSGNQQKVDHLSGIQTNTLTTRYGEAQGSGTYIVENKPKKVGNINPSGTGINGDVYQTEGLAPTLTTNKGEGQKIALPKVVGQLPGDFEMINRVYSPDGIAPTIQTMKGGGHEPKIIQRGHGYNQGGEHTVAPTLTSNSYQENNHVKVYDLYNNSVKGIVGTLTANGHSGSTSAGTFGVQQNFRIRKLTPKECWRLQGFPDEAFDKAQAVNSNSQLYKQAGNSVTVNVISEIAKYLV